MPFLRLSLLLNMLDIQSSSERMILDCHSVGMPASGVICKCIKRHLVELCLYKDDIIDSQLEQLSDSQH